ncbi:hypothetical protein MFU01_76630 [Myxococcus fulvus]|uniref:Uncharacterized protein n=1 Tax=Myxococcus fulvus TaxID=33 RepID=A0A511TEP6_MYXFU|nr:hypothetical protein MFU01_76630 [Myxococcus fulvus]
MAPGGKLGGFVARDNRAPWGGATEGPRALGGTRTCERPERVRLRIGGV